VAQLAAQMVGIGGRVRIVEQYLQRPADRADEGPHQGRRADCVEVGRECPLQVPGDLALGVELNLQGSPPHRGNRPE
jgi:hypothetical protein